MFSRAGLIILTIGFFMLGRHQAFGAVTLDQMKQTGKLMRDVCLPKFKISVEQADQVRDGVFPTDKDGKCYVNCVMEMMQSIKKGKFLYDSSMKQVELLLPDEMKVEYRTGLDSCKTAIKTKNNCDAAMELLGCLHKNIPSFYFP